MYSPGHEAPPAGEGPPLLSSACGTLDGQPGGVLGLTVAAAGPADVHALVALLQVLDPAGTNTSKERLITPFMTSLRWTGEAGSPEHAVFDVVIQGQGAPFLQPLDCGVHAPQRRTGELHGASLSLHLHLRRHSDRQGGCGDRGQPFLSPDVFSCLGVNSHRTVTLATTWLLPTLLLATHL